MTLPNGAQPIIDARKRGLKPSELIIVSMIGPTGENNQTVYVNPDAAYDWRWAVGLQICVFVNAQTKDKAKAVLLALGREYPTFLALWNVDLFRGAQVWALPVVDDIEKPKSQWRHRLDFLPWFEFQNHDFAWRP